MKSGYDLHVCYCHIIVYGPTLENGNVVKYYTIIDFNEVDIRIYLPEKVIIH